MASLDAPRSPDPRAVARLAAGSLDDGDDRILEGLARTWHRIDPVPDDLVARAVFAVALDEVMAEVASIQRLPTGDLTGVRGTQVATSMTFTVEGLTMMVVIGEDGSDTRRLDGWLTTDARGGDDLTVVLHLPESTRSAHAEGGRFSFSRVPRGMVQFVVEDRATGSSLMLTQAVQL